MKALVLALDSDRASAVAQARGFEAEDVVTITSEESAIGVQMERGDVVVIDTNSFFRHGQWPYIMQAARTINAAAGNPWRPVFT